LMADLRFLRILSETWDKLTDQIRKHIKLKLKQFIGSVLS
jgi:hypothetical protein